jgi:hypothetical protein
MGGGSSTPAEIYSKPLFEPVLRVIALKWIRINAESHITGMQSVYVISLCLARRVAESISPVGVASA